MDTGMGPSLPIESSAVEWCDVTHSPSRHSAVHSTKTNQWPMLRMRCALNHCPESTTPSTVASGRGHNDSPFGAYTQHRILPIKDRIYFSNLIILLYIKTYLFSDSYPLTSSSFSVAKQLRTNWT